MAGKSSPPRKSASVTPRAAGKKKAPTKPSRSTSTKPATQAKGPAMADRAKSAGERSPAGLLAQAEADLTALLDSLNSHMATAVNAITELAVAQQGQHQPIIRSRPIDRATAMFQRLVAEVLDDKLAEVLPTLVALRGEMNQRARHVASSASTPPPTDGDFFERGTAMLDQVLNTLEVRSFEPRIGDPFDPLIHLAVGQTSRNDLAEGVLAEILQPGFRTARGKVIVPARVKVNRR